MAQVDPLAGLRAAWWAYIRAPIGRLVVTADELKAAAEIHGWRRETDGPLPAWVRARVEGVADGGQEKG